MCELYRGAEKSLARPGSKEARKYVRDVRDFNNIETRENIKFRFLHGKAPMKTHGILTETLPYSLHGRAKDLSEPLYCGCFNLFCNVCMCGLCMCRCVYVWVVYVSVCVCEGFAMCVCV